jgi:hypothetical protein
MKGFELASARRRPFRRKNKEEKKKFEKVIQKLKPPRKVYSGAVA